MNKCLRHILNISWADPIANKLCKVTDKSQMSQEISTRKLIWIANRFWGQNSHLKINYIGIHRVDGREVG